ncbi:uncharacterized protein PAC_05182 [Phialocephala subalpina]|uniref:Zn(2)-C6 fungal-type domain-containing protein n=1 Tax=Phialocephala subalpina TaxID=576137 RepID=A0A1L7WRC1_9HELO|nr:uncharacterized protein PAC_05182 [Phialocephala subalpina]
MESTRKKSCNQCRLAKTRCSLDAPSCDRCVKRKLPCKYQEQIQRRHASPLAQDGMFHSWLLGTHSTDPIKHNDDPPMYHTSLDNRNSEPLDHQDGSLMNDIYRPNIDWSLDVSLFVTPEPSAANPDLARPDYVETSQTERESSTCWLEHSSLVDSGSNSGTQSVRRGAVAITADDGVDFLSELSSAMKQSSKYVLASFQALNNVPSQIPNIFERKKTSSVSEMMKDNFLWSKIVSYATDFDKTLLPPFVHRSCLMKDDTAQDFDYANLPEALANCKNIVPMKLQTLYKIKDISASPKGRETSQSGVTGLFTKAKEDMNVSRAQAEPCAHFEGISLPCGRSMWHAKTTSVWEDEYKKYLSLREGSAMPTIGNLRKVYGGADKDLDSDLVRDLSNWSKDADDLGSLLLMTAP